MKLAVIIGGSSGIGYEVCRCLNKTGKYKAINMSRHKCDIDGIENIYLDLLDLRSIPIAFSKLYDIYGIPEILVYSSGIIKVCGVQEITEEDLLEVYKVNIFGAILCSKQFIKITKKENNNKIIFLSSTCASRSSPSLSIYSSSKSALDNFAITLSSELKGIIKVFCLHIGRCATKLRREIDFNENQDLIMQPNSVGNFIKNLILNDDDVLDGNIITVRKQ
jgi:NAD(P)-dependent dehydrogenase (short-subunit alcohol dehydrogenase family)